MKLYECTFLDEFSETQMTICDLPTNNVKEIVEIINAYGMTNSSWEYMAVENGVIEITLNETTPNEIFYVADNNINLGGVIRVANIEESSFIDVETEILGKKTYIQTNNSSSQSLCRLLENQHRLLKFHRVK